MKQRVAVLLSFLCLAGAAVAQRPVDPSETPSRSKEVRVRVLVGEREPGQQIRVRIMTSTGVPATETYTDSTGVARVLAELGDGMYYVEAYHPDGRVGRSEVFEVDARFRVQNVQVRIEQASTTTSRVASGGPIAADDLNVPDKARKEFEKGLEALKRDKLDAARKHFDNALKEHPKYASVYNGMGVMAMRAGDRVAGRKAFEQALEVNPKLVSAQINLAKLHYDERQLDDAARLLEQTLSLEPMNLDALLILGNIELMRGNFNPAVTYARRIHDMPHKDYAVAHLIAAQAFENGNQHAEALEEYRLFLKESPGDTPSKPRVEKAVIKLEQQLKAKAN